ncbi:MAG: von Willebrand factor type A domain-containing protein, partial [Oscillospiraceae bacterium]|nr:von Willebrand factor type A domain-containing protein [Oscillospiraceae bacterium]
MTGCGSGDNRYYTTTTQKGDTAQENYINAPEMQDNAAEMEAEGGRDLHYSADMGWYEEPNAEEYNAVTEAGFKNVLQNPLSTFSIDVDTASYSNIRRMLFNGEPVNPDAVRIEEMINYFSYDYPEPADDVPFSVNTEMYDCPWNEETQLFLVGLQAEKIDLSERKPMNLVFLIDVSGSMYSEDKLPLVQEAFAMLAENLNENDRISIVTYAGAEQVVLAGESGSNYPRIAESLYNLTAGGA